MKHICGPKALGAGARRIQSLLIEVWAYGVRWRCVWVCLSAVCACLESGVHFYRNQRLRMILTEEAAVFSGGQRIRARPALLSALRPKVHNGGPVPDRWVARSASHTPYNAVFPYGYTSSAPARVYFRKIKKKLKKILSFIFIHLYQKQKQQDEMCYCAFYETQEEFLLTGRHCDEDLKQQWV